MTDTGRPHLEMDREQEHSRRCGGTWPLPTWPLASGSQAVCQVARWVSLPSFQKEKHKPRAAASVYRSRWGQSGRFVTQEISGNDKWLSGNFLG